MKTKIYIISLLLTAAGINFSFGQDPYEPNDTYETATPVTCGQQLSAYIQITGDVDWYEIEMTDSGVLEVAVTSVPDNLDLNIEIHQLIDNVLTLIADDRVNADPGDNVFSNAVVNAGTYLIKVHVDYNNDFSDSDPYEMALTCTANALELNQIYEEAASIPADTCFEANIYGDNHTYTVANDVDWFEVQVNSSGVLEVAVTSVPDNLDLNVGIHQVIDNVLTLIADDRVNADPGDNVFSNAVVNPGTYLINVHVDYNNTYNEETYSFCTSFTANALELNQIYEEAAPIPADTCFEANIYGDNHTYTVANDVDWFEVQVNSSGVLEVAVTSVPDNLDLNVGIHQVIDNVLTLIADDRVNADPGDNVFSNAVVNPGTYLINVHVDYNNTYNEETYSFCTSFTANALELNQIYEEAAPISMDTCFEANIYGDNHLYTVANDVDWFALEVDEDSYELEIEITSVPDNLDLNLEVYQIIDNELTLIADDGVNADPGDDVFISTIVDAGTYLIKVHVDYNNAYNEDTYNFCLGYMDINEQSLSNQLDVFPNPNNGRFSINLLSENNDLKILEIDIYDHLGRERAEFQQNAFEDNEISVNIKNTARGLYMLRIQTNKGIVTKKILVQ